MLCACMHWLVCGIAVNKLPCKCDPTPCEHLNYVDISTCSGEYLVVLSMIVAFKTRPPCKQDPFLVPKTVNYIYKWYSTIMAKMNTV